MTIQEFDRMDKKSAMEVLQTCCGARSWQEKLMEHFPFGSEENLADKATKVWYHACVEQDWLEAFSHHPRIGDIKSLEKKFASTAHLAGEEQSGVSGASRDTLEALSAGNIAYEQKFGYIFIICATGRSAGEMLQLLHERLHHAPQDEILVAMGEQHKITLLRLGKLFGHAFQKRSQITTHILDTSTGKPAGQVAVRLQKPGPEGRWKSMAIGLTNEDGRIADLIPPFHLLQPGTYKLLFETGDYYRQMNRTGFYPQVEISFTIFDDQHYHVPLLLNPFGYTTYRGS